MKVDERFREWEFIWIRNSNTTIPDEILRDSRVTLIEHQGREYQRALATTQVLVNNTTFPTHFIRRSEQYYINTYHGIPLKKMGFDIEDTLTSIANTQRNFIQATTLLSGGAYTDDFLYKPYGAMPLFEERILHSGFPRIDQTQKPASPELLAQLGVMGRRPLLLFAPTWRGISGSHERGVSQLIRDTEKLYDELGDDFDIFVSYHNLVLNTVKSVPEGIRLVPPGLDINQIMAAVDVLVSDYSSIMVDFLTLDRPLVLYVPDRVEYENTRGLYLDLESLPATLCSTLAEVVSAVRHPVCPSEFATYHQTVETLLPNQDGRATRRVLDEILKPRVKIEHSDKKRLLININSLGSNGITMSFLNLVNSINYEDVEIYIVIDAPSIDASTINMSNFKHIDDRCHKILRIGPQILNVAESAVIRSLGEPRATFDAEAKRIKSTAFARESLRIISDEHFDAAIDFAGYSPFWAHTIAATSAKIKVIFQHNDLNAEFENRHKDHKKLIGVFRAYEEFDRIAPVSTGVGAENYRNLERFYSSQGQVKTIRNVLDVEKIHRLSLEPIEVACPELAAYRDVPTVTLLTVGRLSSEKNQARLIEAFSQARKGGLDAVLFLVGDGHLRSSLAHLIQKLGETDHVFILGHMDNPFPLMKAADYFVLSSDYEGQPMTLLEALTLGTSCIGTNIPGIAAVLEMTDEIMVQPDVDSLASALRLLQKPVTHEENVIFDAHAYTRTVLQEFDTVVFDGQ